MIRYDNPVGNGESNKHSVSFFSSTDFSIGVALNETIKDEKWTMMSDGYPLKEERVVQIALKKNRGSTMTPFLSGDQ